jgi:Flp pilus assembly protein TadD/peroxiredoxin
LHQLAASRAPDSVHWQQAFMANRQGILGFSRRSFIKTAAAAGGFAAARLSGLPAWAQSPRSQPCFLHTGSTFAPFAQHFVDLIEPGNDEFVTEKYALELEDVLAKWGESLASAASVPHAASISFSPELQATGLSHATATPLRRASRGPISSERVSFPAAEKLASSAFEEHLRKYLATLGKIEIAETRISGIEVVGEAPPRLWTAVQYLLVGRPIDGVREQRTGQWEISWQQTGERAAWVVSGWTATDENRSRLTGKGFVDITAEAFGNTPSLQAQLNRGIDYWRTVLDGACAVDIYGNNGISVGDYDNDGFDDLYVCQPSGIPNRLYRNRGDGTFEDVTEKAGVGVIDATSSAIFADLRNSGLQDLIVVRTNGPLLFLNAGDGTFHLKENAFHFANPPQGSFTAVAVADYDLDGLLDVYFCLYSFYQGLSDYQFPTPFYDARNGPPNFLFRNRGDGVFEDATQATGMNTSNNRYTLACSWNDYNQDGHPDLYVVNDFGRKVLYRNNGDGTFTDVSAEMGVEDQGEGMSSTWFDYDNDGFDDLYAVNMWEAAGKRVTTQKQFMPAVTDAVRGAYRRDAGGNSLLHHDRHSGKFEDVTDDSCTRVGGWNWSSGAWDLDNDGYQELYVANGFITGPASGPVSGPVSGRGKRDLSSFYWRQIVTRSIEAGGRSKGYEEAWSTINEAIRSDYTWSGRQRNNLYLNNGDGSFVESASILGLDCLEDGRAFSLADIDGDGRLEVIVKNRTAPQLRVFHNQLQLTGDSIAFSLKGTTCNRDAIGAVVELKTTAGVQRQTVVAGSGFLSQHTKTLFFGLGESAANRAGAAPATVTALVHWPGGKAEEFKDLPVNCRLHLQQGKGVQATQPFRPHAVRDAGKPLPDGDDLFSPSETWLVEPIAPPDFRLTGAHGAAHSLASLKGATLLIFTSPDCGQSHEHLRAVAAAWPKLQQYKLDVIAMSVSEEPAGTAYGTLPFPVLTADAQTQSVYNIFYRYLFERRRDIPLPTAFLLDASQNVVKVYTGGFVPARVLKDHLEAPRDAASRIERALPFKGNYYGAGFHHNYFTYGVAYLQYEYLDQALSCFERAVEINPSQAGAYYNIGLIYLGKDVLDKAQANLEKAVELDPSDANAWNNLGVVNGENGDYDAAQRYFEKTLSLRPSHLLAVQNLVKLYDYKEKPDDALRVLQAAVAAEPSSAPLHLEFGMFYAGKGDFTEAEREFNDTVRLQPRNAAALNGLGAIAMRRGDTETAMKDFRECVEIAPDFDRPYLNMTSMLLNSGKAQEAHDLLAGYLAKHPDNAEIKEALVQVDSKR